MNTRNVIILYLIIFICGVIAGVLMGAKLSVTITISILSVIILFLGIVFNRIKHIEDLNFSRKKEVSLEYIKYMSEYRSAIISVTTNVSFDEYQENLLDATKNMVGALDKLHVVSNDKVSSEVELKNFEITSLMAKITKKSIELNNDNIELMKWLIDEGILSNLNMIRYEIITLIDSEIGDGSGTSMLRTAIEKNNKDFTALLSEMIK